MEIMASDGNYLVQAKSITKGYGFPPPVFLGDQILSAEGSMAQDANNPQEMVVVMLDGREVFTTTAGIPSPVPFLIGLWSDSKHWTLEIARASGDAVHFQVDGEIFQDGRSLNQQYGYQATFEYQLLGGKPFYFYQKDGQIGISYAGQEIPLGFEEVSHYLCCSAGALNPRRYGPLIQFFARKGETWYYIEALAGDE